MSLRVYLGNDLASLVNAQGAPSNPATPDQRQNPEHDWYTSVQTIRRCIEEALEKFTERGPETEAILNGMRGGCSKLLTPELDPKLAAIDMAITILKPSAPMIVPQLQALLAQMSAPSIAPGGGGASGLPIGALGAQPGLPGGAPTAGPPPPAPPNGGADGGAPVSPVVAAG